VERDHAPGPRRGDLDDGLGGLDLDEGLVERDLLALGHEPRRDDGLLEPLAQVRQDEHALGHQ
jgi:hypothetical protein